MAGRKWIALMAAMLIFLGFAFLWSGEIPQGEGCGPSEFPPLEGSLARFGGLFMIISGVAFVLIAFRKKPSDQTKKIDDHDTTDFYDI